MSSAQGEHDAGVRLLVIVAAVVTGVGFALALVIWLAGQLAALLSGSGWPDAGPGDAPGILVRFVRHPSDPALAWPEAARSAFGPTWLFLFILAVFLVGLAYVAITPLTCAVLAAVPGRKADGQRGDSPASAPPCVDAQTASGKPVVTYTVNSTDVQRFEVRIGLADNRVMTITSGGAEQPPALPLDQLIRIAEEATNRIK